jgi:hypothetical protein
VVPVVGSAVGLAEGVGAAVSSPVGDAAGLSLGVGAELLGITAAGPLGADEGVDVGLLDGVGVLVACGDGPAGVGWAGARWEPPPCTAVAAVVLPCRPLKDVPVASSNAVIPTAATAKTVTAPARTLRARSGVPVLGRPPRTVRSAEETRCPVRRSELV